jgi:hypothetical protein
VVTRLMLIFLCLGILSTVTGCYVESTSYRTSYGGGTDYETRQDRNPWVRQNGPYHPWERYSGYGSSE